MYKLTQSLVYNDANKSLLIKYLDELLHKLESIGNKYFAQLKQTKKNKSDEHAIILFNAITTVLTRVRPFISKFDKGRVPNTAELLLLINSLKDLLEFERLFFINEIALFLYTTRNLPEIIVQAVTNLHKKKLNKNSSIVDSYSKQELIELILSINKQLELKNVELIRQLGFFNDKNYTTLINDIYEAVLQIDVKKFISPNLLNNALLAEQLGALIENKLFFDLNSKGFVISHPMIYELSLVVLQMIRELPPELHKLVPFFNPNALVFDFTSGLIGILANSYIEGGIKFELCEANENTSSYCYLVTLGTNTQRIDAQIEYREKQAMLTRHIHKQITRYYLDYCDSIYVKSELSKNKMYIQFLDSELLTIENTVNKYFVELKNYSNLTMNESSDYLILSELNHSIELSLSQNQKIIDELNEKKEKYKSLSFSQLINGNETIISQIERDKKSFLDVSYLSKPLPELVIEYSEKSNMIKQEEVWVKLFCEIDKGVKRLTLCHVQLIDLLKLNQSLASKIENKLREEFIFKATKRIEECNQKCIEFNRSLSELLLKESSLDLKLKCISVDQLHKLIEQHNEFVSDLKLFKFETDKVEKQLKLDLLVPFKDMGFIEKSYSEAQDQIRKLNEFGQFKIKNIENKLENLKLNYKKLKDEEEFTSNLSKSGLDTLVQLIHELNQKLDEDNTQKIKLLNLLEVKKDCLRETNSEFYTIQKHIDELNLFCLQIKSKQNILISELTGLLTVFSGNYSDIALEEFSEFLNDKLHAIEITLINLEKSVEFFNEFKGDKESHIEIIDEIKESQEKILVLHDLYTVNLKSYVQANSDLNRYKIKLECLAEENRVFNEEIYDVEQKIQDLAKQIDEKKQKLKVLIRVQELYTNYKALQIQIKNLEIQSKDLNSLSFLTQYSSDLSKLKQESKICLQGLDELEHDLKSSSEFDFFTHSVAQLNSFQTHNDHSINELVANSYGLIIQNEYASILDLDKQTLKAHQSIEHIDSISTVKDKLDTLNLLAEQINNLNALICSKLDFLNGIIKCLKLVQFKEFNLNFEELEKAKVHLKNTIELTNKKLFDSKFSLNRIKKRGQLRASYSSAIDKYLELRAKKYILKDSIFKEDKHKRTEFLNSVKISMDVYTITGDSSSLINLAKAGKENFPGINFRSLINRLIVDIKAEELEVSNKTSKSDYSKSTEIILNRLSSIHPKYVMQIRNLRNKIQVLNEYGIHLAIKAPEHSPIIIDFSRQLITDLDCFINSQETKISNQKAISIFQETMITRLHSMDDFMLNHREQWKPILANIIIALFTIGIAPVVQLVYSKIVEGCCSLFFSQTQRGRLIEAIESSTQNLSLELI